MVFFAIGGLGNRASSEPLPKNIEELVSLVTTSYYEQGDDFWSGAHDLTAHYFRENLDEFPYFKKYILPADTPDLVKLFFTAATL